MVACVHFRECEQSWLFLCGGERLSLVWTDMKPAAAWGTIRWRQTAETHLSDLKEGFLAREVPMACACVSFSLRFAWPPLDQSPLDVLGRFLENLLWLLAPLRRKQNHVAYWFGCFSHTRWFTHKSKFNITYDGFIACYCFKRKKKKSSAPWKLSLISLRSGSKSVHCILL